MSLEQTIEIIERWRKRDCPPDMNFDDYVEGIYQLYIKGRDEIPEGYGINVIVMYAVRDYLEEIKSKK